MAASIHYGFCYCNVITTTFDQKKLNGTASRDSSLQLRLSNFIHKESCNEKPY